MDIDKLFKDVLRDKEINPSDAAWDKLSESLKQEMPSAESSSSSLEPQSVFSSIKAASIYVPGVTTFITSLFTIPLASLGS